MVENSTTTGGSTDITWTTEYDTVMTTTYDDFMSGTPKIHNLTSAGFGVAFDSTWVMDSEYGWLSGQSLTKVAGTASK